MAKASPRPHRAALTRMLRATGLAQVPEEAPLVELLRSLADELDNGGGSRPRIEYRAALKDARQVLKSAPGSSGASKAEAEETESSDVVADEPAVEPGVADFASFRRAKGSASSGAG